MSSVRRSIRSTSKRSGSRAVGYAAAASARRFKRHQLERALTDVRMTDPAWVDVGSRTVAAAAAAGARAAVYQLSDRKMRFWDMSSVFSTIIGGGGRNYDFLQEIGVGAQNVQRVGREITVTGMRLSFTLESAHSHVVAIEDEYNNVRVVVSLFRKPGMAVNGNYINSAMTIHGAIVPEYESGLVKIFYDKVHLLLPTYYKEGIEPRCGLKNVHIWIPMNERVTYPSDVAAGGDKSLVVSMFSDSEASPHPWVSSGVATVFWRG